MDIKIYDQEYTVEHIPQEDISKEFHDKNNQYFGMVDSNKNIIYIANEVCDEKEYFTLAHEITHAIIHDKMVSKDKYTEEDVCDIMAGHYREVNRIIEELKKNL